MLPFKDFRCYTTFKNSPPVWRVYFPDHRGFEIVEELDGSYKVIRFSHNWTLFKPKFSSNKNFHISYTNDITICKSAEEVNKLLT